MIKRDNVTFNYFLRKMEIKTSDLWIYNFDKFNYWFFKRPSNIKLPLSIFHARRHRSLKNTHINSESFLISLLFYLYTQRIEYDISVCKSSAVRQVLANGANLVEIKFNNKPFVYSAYLCGVYEFNNTIAVKLGFKKDGLIKVSKKNFTRLFVENEFYTQNYGFVDLISCPPVGFDNKFLDFELIIPETSTYDFLGFSRKNIIIPDCLVFVKRSKTLKYAFSNIINLGELKASYKNIKYSKQKVRRYLNLIPQVKKPYIFKVFILFSRLVFSTLYFNSGRGILNSNFHLYKLHIILKRVLSLFKIITLIIKEKYFKIYKFSWYPKFQNLLSDILNNLKLNLILRLDKRDSNALALPKLVPLNELHSKISTIFSFFAKRELVSFNLMDFALFNGSFLNVLFYGSKLLVTKYSVRRLKDFNFKHYFMRKVNSCNRLGARTIEKLKIDVIFKRLKLEKQFKLLKLLKMKIKKKFRLRKYKFPKIINFTVPLNRSNLYQRILPYYNLFFYKSKHNLMYQVNIENLGFYRVKKKLNLLIPRRRNSKYREVVSKFLKNYSRNLNSLFLRNLAGNISALNKDVSVNSLESAAIVRRLLKANKRRLVYIFCFKHYRIKERKRRKRMRKLLRILVKVKGLNNRSHFKNKKRKFINILNKRKIK